MRKQGRLPPSPDTSSDSEAECLAFARGAKADNTRRAYAFDLEDFRAFCSKRSLSSFPASPDTVATYLRDSAERRRLKLTTVARRLAAIADAHNEVGLQSPCDEWIVRNTLRRLRRELGQPANGKAPISVSDLLRIMEIMPESLAGTRDRAILLLGFAGAMRRSELAGLTLDRLALAREGLVVTLPRGKTDQVGQGRTIGIPYGQNELTCPVRAVLRWIDEANISEGALFRKVNKNGHAGTEQMSDRVVAEVVKKHTGAIGKRTENFSGHSLRAGLATDAALAGVPAHVIQDQTGHRSLAVLQRYIRKASVFRLNAAAKVGL